MLKFAFLLLILGGLLLAVRIWTGTSMAVLFRRHVGSLLCTVIGHRRDSASVHRTDEGYRARCRRCDTRLAKASRDADWVVVAGQKPNPYETERRLTETGGARPDHADAVDTREEGSA